MSGLDQASLYNLADDLSETRDLSQTQPDKKQQLFAAYRQYFAQRKLKPLAAQVAERKQTEKSRKQAAPKREKGTRRESSSGRPNAKLSKELREEVAALKKEFGQRRAELQKQLDGLLTDDQKQARDAARKKALDEGKGGVKLRTVMDEALNLTPDQKKKFDELRLAIGQLTREQRRKLQQIVQDSESNQ